MYDVQITLMWLPQRCIINLGAHGRSVWKGLCVFTKINFSVSVKKMKWDFYFRFAAAAVCPRLHQSLNNIIIPSSSPQQL